MDPTLSEDEERFMRWLEDGNDVQGHSADIGLPEAWHAQRNEAEKLGALLRDHMATHLEPPNPEAFNQQVRQRLG